MSLGAGAYKVGGARQCSSMRRYPWQPREQAPTRYCYTEQFSGILTNQYLPSPVLQREGGIGKTKAQNGKQRASYCNNTLQRTASKHEVPLLEALGHPQYSWKNC